MVYKALWQQFSGEGGLARAGGIGWLLETPESEAHHCKGLYGGDITAKRRL